MTDDPDNSTSDHVEPTDGIDAEVTDAEVTDAEDTDPGYQPSYTEPTYGTGSYDNEWETPTEAGSTSDDAGVHASPPDSTPLTEVQASTGSGTEQVEPAAPWWGGAQATGRGASSLGEESGQSQPPYSQQAPWGGPPQGPPYQQDAPTYGMPPQYYGGGYSPMTMGSHNPYWLAGPSDQGRSTITMDYWLSVFFQWIPALIFFLTEKDKNKLVDEHTKEILNFSLTRVIVGAVMVIPVIGWIVGGIASLALFIVAILGALKGPEEYAKGRTYQYPLAFRFIK